MRGKIMTAEEASYGAALDQVRDGLRTALKNAIDAGYDCKAYSWGSSDVVELAQMIDKINDLHKDLYTAEAGEQEDK